MSIRFYFSIRLPVGAFIVALLVGMLAGCATVVHPGADEAGAWARPADLRLRFDSLRDVVVRVACARLRDDGSYVVRPSQACQGLTAAMREVGATVVKKDDELEPEYTLLYLDGESRSEGCGWMSIATWLSSGIVPCTSLDWSVGELRLLDSRGVVLSKAPLRLKTVTVFGWAALGSRVFYGREQRRREKQLQKRFVRYAQNFFYSGTVARHAPADADDAPAAKEE